MDDRGSARTFRRTLIAVALLGGALAGCSSHKVEASNPCPGATTAKLVVVSNRGAIGLAKVGLTPDALSAEEKCD